MRCKRTWMAVIVCTVLIAAPAIAAAANKTAEQKAMEEDWAKAGQPGPYHDHLKPLIGKWKLVVKWWTDPAGEPNITQRVATTEPIMGGLFVKEEVQGEMMGRPFQGLGFTGYDTVAGKFVSTWIDNMGSAIMVSEGRCEGDCKTIHWTGTYSDAMSGKTETSKQVLRIVNDTTHVFEMSGKGPDGREFKMIEITYTRM